MIPVAIFQDEVIVMANHYTAVLLVLPYILRQRYGRFIVHILHPYDKFVCTRVRLQEPYISRTGTHVVRALAEQNRGCFVEVEKLIYIFLDGDKFSN